MADVTSLDRAKQLSRAVWKYQNEVRQNPLILIPVLEEDLRHFQGNSIWLPGQPGMVTEEGTAPWHEAIAFLKAQPVLPPLEWNDALEAAAIDHAYDLGPKGKTGHVGSDNSSIGERIKRHGKWLEIVGENISFGPADPVYIIKQLIVDDGTPSRGHRTNIFMEQFRTVGVGAAPHTVYGSTCVLDYAGGMAPGGTTSYAPKINPKVFDIAKRKEEQLAKARALAEDMPLGCVSRSVKKTTKVSGGTKVVTVTTVWKFADGREETKVEVESSGPAAKCLAPPAARVMAAAPASGVKAANAKVAPAPSTAAAGTGAVATRRPGPTLALSHTAAGKSKPCGGGAVPFGHIYAQEGAKAGIQGLLDDYDSCDHDMVRPDRSSRPPAGGVGVAPTAAAVAPAAARAISHGPAAVSRRVGSRA